MSSKWSKEFQKKQMEQRRRQGMYLWQQQQKKTGVRPRTRAQGWTCSAHANVEAELDRMRKEIIEIKKELERLGQALSDLNSKIERDYAKNRR